MKHTAPRVIGIEHAPSGSGGERQRVRDAIALIAASRALPKPEIWLPTLKAALNVTEPGDVIVARRAGDLDVGPSALLTLAEISLRRNVSIHCGDVLGPLDSHLHLLRALCPLFAQIEQTNDKLRAELAMEARMSATLEARTWVRMRSAMLATLNQLPYADLAKQARGAAEAELKAEEQHANTETTDA